MPMAIASFALRAQSALGCRLRLLGLHKDKSHPIDYQFDMPTKQQIFDVLSSKPKSGNKAAKPVKVPVKQADAQLFAGFVAKLKAKQNGKPADDQ